MVVCDVAFQQNICLQQASGGKCRQEDKWDEGMHRNRCGTAVRNNCGGVGRAGLGGPNVVARSTRRTVPGQLCFHRKNERQNAQAKGKCGASESSGSKNS